MKGYFKRTLQSVSLIGIISVVEIIASYALFLSLNATGMSENTSLLIAFLTLVGLIVLGLLLFPKSIPSFREEAGTSILKWLFSKRRSMRYVVLKQNELLEQLVQSYDSLAHNVAKQQESIIQLTHNSQVSTKQNSNEQRQIESIEQLAESLAQQQKSIEQLAESLAKRISIEEKKDKLIEKIIDLTNAELQQKLSEAAQPDTKLAQNISVVHLAHLLDEHAREVLDRTILESINKITLTTDASAPTTQQHEPNEHEQEEQTNTVSELTSIEKRMQQQWNDLVRAEQEGVSLEVLEQMYDSYIQATEEYNRYSLEYQQRAEAIQSRIDSRRKHISDRKPKTEAGDERVVG